MPAPKNLAKVEGLLLDLDGVVHVRDKPVPGSLEAIGRLRAAKIPFRFVTNTTRRPRRKIVEGLFALGLVVAEDELFTPASLTRDLLGKRGRAPLLVIHPDLREDFVGVAEGADAVVIGDAGENFTYDALNGAFRALSHGAEFFALARNRNFLDADGELSLDVGGFVAALEYASAREATVIGKPSREFFHAAVEALNVPERNVLMVGDDAEADVGGAMAAGLLGVLVKTGKYRAGQEKGLFTPPTLIADDLAAIVELLLEE
ncbi:TIGR01458 family HAD-type hydrolase [Rhodoblastus acidophilus]|uniref:Haloacid dehalogenase-like hydrolase domain-containing protein 2 n=1 Tax=Candidatus Rhodoblastus alkanivorans TaxID=2954117 RepID=A0ABS9Z5S5_9HYPH|nr:TIGR01458 family HAD-type hydrolase [Candidatus Rhodoblastus alkanivorans]MCI4678614.1 TIGR01458 family HAD-type hydrolase [Candidatus Rhodoblastus alkanivorans]MCI4683024.1 TIGR01458 family HAD-type hydrolase [Candidatus Rhodoblastus alkanivorans]MDI4640334.1 TIGR01458 family HAD-type hydrolase [Rhodoblastus acidophilus]